MSGLLDVVMGFEGWNPKAYGDYKQWSVGYGTKAKHPGEVIDQEEGKRRLQAELDQARGYVTQKFPNLAPNQADALTSFTYNLGPGWMSQPTRLRAALEKGDMQTAAQVMQLYNKAGGEVLPGLVKRRASEAAMFLGGPVPSGSPVASSPSPQGAAPSMDTSSQKPFSLAGLLSEKLNNPLFLMGAGIYSAGSQGKDIGSGILMGSQVAQQAAQAQMQQEAMRRKLAAQQAQDKLWNTLDTNPAVAGMTPEQRQMIKALGPEQGGALLSELIKSQIAPGPQYDFKPAGESLYRVNKKTGQAEPVASAVKPTSDVLNYREAVQQGYKGTFQDYQMELRKAGATAITTDMRGENAEAKARGEGLGKRLNSIADDGVEADKDMAILSRITALQGNIEPGTKTALMEEIRAATGITLDPNTDNVQAFKAAANYLVPRMRVPGSGASSDRDVQIFQRSLPSLLGTPGGNELVTQTLGGLAQHRKDRAEIAAEWQRGEITAAEADKKMRSLPDPFATFKKAVGDQRFGAPAGKATGNENLPRPKTPQEAMRLPSGTKFIDADGNVRTRP